MSANAEITRKDPWRIPSSNVFDLSASYRFNIGKINATLYGNVDNLFNQLYITDAKDSQNSGNWEDVSVLYSWGRTYSVRLKINF